jgi:hypothetical protein
MMVAVFENADDQRDQLNDHTAEQQEHFPGHIHTHHLPQFTLRKARGLWLKPCPKKDIDFLNEN